MKANLPLEMTQQTNKTTNTSMQNFRVESKIIDLNPNLFQDQNQLVKHRYTVKQGDYKRLNKDGVLKVYNMNEPVEIPVTSMLGKWKNTHIGVTFFRIGEEWKVIGRQAEALNFVPQEFISKMKRLIVRFKPLYFFDKFFEDRLNGNNMLKDA